MSLRGLPGQGISDADRSLLLIIGAVGIGTLGAKLVLVAREILLARTFGTNDALDAFFLAYSVPQFLISIIAASLPAAFLPTFIDYREHGQTEQGTRLLHQTAGLGLVALSLLAAILIVFAYPIVSVLASGFDSAKLAETATLLRIMSAVLPLAAFSRLWAGAANAGGRYFIPALANSGASLGVVLWIAVTADPNVRQIAVAVVLGAALELAFTARALRKAGMSPRASIPKLSPSMRRVLRQLLPVSFAAGLASASLIIDNAMASPLGTGAVAAINLGNRLALFITGLLSLTLSAALLPRMSELVARGNIDALRALVWRSSSVIGVLSLAVVAAGYHLSRPIAEFAYLGGSFTNTELLLVADLQKFYLLQLPFFAVSVVGVRVLTAMERGRDIAYISISNLIVNVAGNALFIRLFGLRGVAMSTAIVYLMSAIWVAIAVFLALRRPPSPSRTAGTAM